MKKSPVLYSFILALFVAAILSVSQDFIFFEYNKSGTIFSRDVWKKLDETPVKNLKEYLSDHSKKQSVVEKAKYLLNQYKHKETWQFKLKQTLLYFLAIYLGFIVFIFKYRVKGKR